MKYLICCNKIVPWYDLDSVAIQEDQDLLVKTGHRIILGKCPTCKTTRAYHGQLVAGFELDGSYVCLACYSYKPEEFKDYNAFYANRRWWKRSLCDICGEELAEGYIRKYAP